MNGSGVHRWLNLETGALGSVSTGPIQRSAERFAEVACMATMDGLTSFICLYYVTNPDHTVPAIQPGTGRPIAMHAQNGARKDGADLSLTVGAQATTCAKRFCV
jgi:hypothetical protein